MSDGYSSPESDDAAEGYVGRRRWSPAPPHQHGDIGYVPQDAPGFRQRDAQPGPPHDDAEHLLVADYASGDNDDAYDDRPPIFEGRYPERGRGGGAMVAIVAAVLVAGLVLGGALILRGVLDRGGDTVGDYQGEGSGSASIVVHAGDSLTQIARTLTQADVIARPDPFLSAASATPAATSIQPGTYSMRQKMSGAAALKLMLDPASRNVIKVTIPEGYRIDQVRALLADKLQAPVEQVSAALADIPSLGIPADFGQVSSAEGFLYPATYDFQPGTTPAAALRAMVQAFAEKASAMGLAAKATAQGVSPYQALIIASMAEAEATNPADWAKVSRVIYNRAQQQMPLGIDATSTYEARINGTDPADINYQAPSPYNTRVTPGYPPTPIGSPGEATLTAAVTPAAGDWLYYVQSDAAGSLAFTNDYNAFLGMAQKCRDNGWGNC